MPRTGPHTKWSEERRARFVREWNDGLESDALRERYSVKSPGSVAALLRAMGYVLADRSPGKRVA